MCGEHLQSPGPHVTLNVTSQDEDKPQTKLAILQLAVQVIGDLEAKIRGQIPNPNVPKTDVNNGQRTEASFGNNPFNFF